MFNTEDKSNSRNKKKVLNKFQKHWLSIENYKEWLKVKNSDESLCECRVCPNKSFMAKLSVVQIHSSFQKHIINLKNSCVSKPNKENKNIFDFQSTKDKSCLNK